jgi:hypothetical protein
LFVLTCNDNTSGKAWANNGVWRYWNKQLEDDVLVAKTFDTIAATTIKQAKKNV